MISKYKFMNNDLKLHIVTNQLLKLTQYLQNMGMGRLVVCCHDSDSSPSIYIVILYVFLATTSSWKIMEYHMSILQAIAL